MTEKRLISIVIPLFNEEGVFGLLRERLESMLALLVSRFEVEVVLVDDGSRDRTWDLIDLFAGENSAIRGISLSRNFGHQNALHCGYQFTTGEAVISMDGDLQDPPELVARLLDRWEDGFDIVFAVRRNRHGENRFKRWTAFWFYRLLDRLADVDAPLDCGDFRLMSRAALDALLRMGDKQKYLRGMVGWIGFSSAKVDYDRPARAGGQSKFSLIKMARLASHGIASFSNAPLRIAFFLSLVAPLPFLIYLAYVLVLHFFTAKGLVPGWTSLLLCVIIFGSLNLIAIGIIGEYLAKIFETVKQRPDSIVRRQTGGKNRR